MPGVVDVEVVIDTRGVLAEYADPSQDSDEPTPVVGDYCYLITRPSFIPAGQATADLHVHGPIHRAVQWRALSLSGNTSQAAVIYNIERLGRTHITGPISPVERSYECPLPILQGSENTSPPSFSTEEVDGYALRAEITGRGRGNFAIQFYITEDRLQNGEPTLVGYFEWRSALTVHRF